MVTPTCANPCVLMETKVGYGFGHLIYASTPRAMLSRYTFGDETPLLSVQAALKHKRTLMYIHDNKLLLEWAGVQVNADKPIWCTTEKTPTADVHTKEITKTLACKELMDRTSREMLKKLNDKLPAPEFTTVDLAGIEARFLASMYGFVKLKEKKMHEFKMIPFLDNQKLDDMSSDHIVRYIVQIEQERNDLKKIETDSKHIAIRICRLDKSLKDLAEYLDTRRIGK